MSGSELSFFSRLSLAFGAFFRILGGGEFANGVARLGSGEAPPTAPPPKAEPPKPVLREGDASGALLFLSLLQREGRFVDFLEEDVAHFSDAEIGAAARVVHEGCRKAVRDHIKLAPVRSEEEGARVTLERGFDAAAIRVTGNVVGEPPFTGVIKHRGWRATEAKLPLVGEGHDARVVAAAEIEL